MIEDRAQVAFGIFTLIVGVGMGYFIYTRPEGLNPEWPLGLAMLVPVVFALAGLHMAAAGLGYTHLSYIMIRGILVCFAVIFNWAAFFTKHFECRNTVSFLGIPVINRYPSEEECRLGLQVIIGTVDALVIFAIGAYWWHRRRASRKEG